MPKKPSPIELKTTPQKKTQHELVEEIAHLYKKFSNVKEYYQASMFDDDAAVLEEYKKIVRDEFVPTTTRYPKMRASVARQAISNYKKVSCSSSGIAGIMLSYVEAGIDDHPEIKTVELVVQCDNKGAFFVVYFHNGKVEIYTNPRLSIDRKYLKPNPDWEIASEQDFDYVFEDTENGISLALDIAIKSGQRIRIRLQINIV